MSALKLSLVLAVAALPLLAAPPAVAAKTVGEATRAPSVANLPATASGFVTDAQTGDVLSGVLVQQVGAVTSAFTQSDGSFRLLLERNGQAQLTVSAVGYETHTVAINGTQRLRITLSPLSGFIQASPTLPNVPVGQSKAETAPLNTGLIFAYRLRQQTVETGGASYKGLATNDFKLGARFRLRPWLFEAEGAHYETPIDVNGLDRVNNPAFRPSTWQAGLRAGLLTPLFNDDLELAGALGYRWTNTVPNNNDVPYTGSDIDWEQSRHAIGPVVTLAWRPGRGKFHAEGSLGYYPIVKGTTEVPGNTFGDQSLMDVRGILGYELTPGMRLGLGYQAERWAGNGSDFSHVYSFQVHYTPGGAPKGNEP